MKINPDAMNPDLVSLRIGVPLDHWFGQCHLVAVLIHRAGLVGGHVRYGKYLGEISPQSLLHGVTTRHGWIEVDDQVYDPTRWVWENVEPYIYVGPKSEYLSEAEEKAERSSGFLRRMAEIIGSLIIGSSHS